MRLICTIVMLALMSACAVPNRTIGPAPHIPTIANPAPAAPVVAPPLPEPPQTTPKPVAVTSASPSTPVTPSMPVPAKSAYKNCTQVNAAGKGPIKRGEPGWADWLDHDGDGVACFPKKR